MNKKIDIFQKSIIAFLCLIISILLIFLVPITANDELWNFQNIYKMFNGLTIYNDSNVIVTPIFFYIGYIILKFFSANIIFFRIYNLVIYFLLYFIIFKILKNLKVCKNLTLLYTIFAFLLTFQVVPSGANYNTLAILFSLIGLSLYVSKKSNNLLQGLIAFLVFFTKQNIGIFYIISVLIYELYINKLSKKYIINQIKKLLFFLIPTCILLLKLYFDNNIFGFFNYCFGGLLEFGKNNFAFYASSYYLLIPIITIVLFVIALYYRNTIFKKLENVFFQNLALLFIFSVMHTFMIFPIINSAHLIYTFPFHLIFIFYFFDNLIFSDLFHDNSYKIRINIFGITILMIILLRIIANFITDYKYIKFYNTYNSPFNFTFIVKENIEKLDVLKNYIQEKNSKGIDVIIISYDSAFPMVELKQNHGVYDLLFNGNLGYNGKEKIKEDILNRENAEFLVVTDKEDLFEQEPPEIREFIIDNLNFKSKICNYSVYSK